MERLYWDAPIFHFISRCSAGFCSAHMEIIDGSRGTVRRLRSVLAEQKLLGSGGKGEIRFACSGREPDYLRKMQQAFELYHSRGTANTGRAVKVTG